METIGFKCPQCGQEFHPRIAELKLASSTTCPACNSPIDYDPSTIAAAAEQIEKAFKESIEDFARSSKVFKLKK